MTGLCLSRTGKHLSSLPNIGFSDWISSTSHGEGILKEEGVRNAITNRIEKYKHFQYRILTVPLNAITIQHITETFSSFGMGFIGLMFMSAWSEVVIWFCYFNKHPEMIIPIYYLYNIVYRKPKMYTFINVYF